MDPEGEEVVDAVEVLPEGVGGVASLMPAHMSLGLYADVELDLARKIKKLIQRLY